MTCRKLHHKLYNYPKTLPLTPNHLVFARMLNHASSNDRSLNNPVLVESKIKISSSLIKHFWDCWCKEYIANLREYHCTYQKISINLTIKLKYLVLVHNDFVPRYLWRTGVVTELYYSNLDNKIRGAPVRLNRLGQTIKRPINKLYPSEMIKKINVQEIEKRT